MRSRFSLPSHLRYLLGVTSVLLVVFTMFRSVLVFLTREGWTGDTASLLLPALGMGLRFDMVIAAYLLLLPFLLLSVTELVGWRPRVLTASLNWYFGTLGILAFLICAADLPFYAHFNTRLTVDSLQWIDSPLFVLGMIVEDPSYLPFLIGFLVLSILWVLFLARWRTRHLPAWTGRRTPDTRWSRHLPLALLGALLLLAGARGRLDEKSPIRWGTAFFSSSPLANQTGLNPVYTLVQSWRDSRKYASLSLISEAKAWEIMREELRVPASSLDNPLGRHVVPEEPARGWNLVLVIMENMSAAKMEWGGNRDRLTPRLDSLARSGLLFTRMFSTGTHTYNGVYSTLFGLPSLLHIHPMKDIASMQRFGGLAWTLRNAGYSTMYFTTHDEQFDNIGGFLSANGFDRVVSKKDYPSSRVESTLGVPDHALFELALPELRNAAASGRPFFATLLTASDHSPYVLPTDIPFRPRHADLPRAMVEYADWSLGHFMDLVRREPWSANTLFAFVADHGTNFGGPYDITLSFHTIPFIVLVPGTAPARLEGLASQMDVGPTLLGLLRQPWINTTMGIDLLAESRRHVVFCEDRTMACLDSSLLYIRRPDGRESLHEWKSLSPENLLPRRSDRAATLRAVTLATFQSAQGLIRRHLVAPVSPPRTR